MDQLHSQCESKPYRVAFAHACWHQDIVLQSHHGFVAEMARLGHGNTPIDVFPVPGSLELPLHVKTLALSGRYDVIVAAGFVVDGGIYRHEFVAQSVIDGLVRVSLDTDVPVLSLVLTPHAFQEHAEHQQFFSSHMVKKGAEAARACVQIVAATQHVRGLAAHRAA